MDILGNEIDKFYLFVETRDFRGLEIFFYVYLF